MDSARYTEAQRRAHAAEQALFDDFRAALPAFAEAAAGVWHVGDGDGGYVFDELVRAVDQLIDRRDPLVSDGRTKDKISGTLRTQVFERDRYRCVDCGTWKDLTVDHIVAEANGGPTALENLQTLCRSCNSSKGTR